MKALTIHQPWASLIIHGVKTIETRGWACPKSLIGERLAIHAGKSTEWAGEDVGDWSFEPGPVNEPEMVNRATMESLPAPLGAILGTVQVTACLPMVDGVIEIARRLSAGEITDDEAPDRLTRWWHHDAGFADVTDQLPYGDFRPGRWAWMLTDPEPTEVRCPWCLGDGSDPNDPGWSWGGHLEPGSRKPCPICVTEPIDIWGRCEPIPARGKQGLWEWKQ